ncbi:MAG TPA: protein adenylyltransferase SelO family protein, partial [Sedimentibacter sp.]|nr:protein adenylyltransferase SelO family protein [Sedimentibacter sp.]
MTNTRIKTSWNLENSYAELPEFFYSKINLSKVSSPKLVVLNNELAEYLGLDINELQSEEGVSYFAGNSVPKGSIPIAQAYAGHQFGYFTMLGDGRAMLLGEQITPNGKYDIQLKGSGRTPYSRGGDGRAALGPMLREYIVSEAMHALDIPTSRSLAVVTTGEPVIREKILKVAILTRVASSHIRVGTFEYAANFGTEENVRQLADYTIDRHYKEIEKDDFPYLSFLKEVVKRQASLIAKWQLVGFIHGVMNTDNMALSGETIDY